MRAYISSALDALILLQGLQEKAEHMTDYSITSNGASKRNATLSPSLRLTKTVDGETACVTIFQHDKRTLVASLENNAELANATVKRRLATLLIPLVTDYVGADGSESLSAEQRVRIIFGQTIREGRRGKTCILFAEGVANQFSSKVNGHG